MQSRRFSGPPLIGAFAIIYVIPGFSERLIKRIKLDKLEADIERAVGVT